MADRYAEASGWSVYDATTGLAAAVKRAGARTVAMNGARLVKRTIAPVAGETDRRAQPRWLVAGLKGGTKLDRANVSTLVNSSIYADKQVLDGYGRSRSYSGEEWNLN
jgi:hypothetical protein